MPYRQAAHSSNALTKTSHRVMSSKNTKSDDKKSFTMNSKQLKLKISQFLNAKTQKQPLLDIIFHFEGCVGKEDASVTSCLLAVEQIFTDLLMNREMVNETKPSKSKDVSQDQEHREWLRERYSDVWFLILSSMKHPNVLESTQALVTGMRLISIEGKKARATAAKGAILFPLNHFTSIIQKLLSSERANKHLINRFKEYGAYLDVVFYTWKMLPGLTLKGTNANDTYIQNYLDLINVVPISAQVQDDKQVLACPDGTYEFDYPATRKSLNKVWSCAVLWTLSDTTHKQFLIVLLERILSHLDKPVLLTDFLMDSLDVGGPISLLALQGVFILIQHHNLTYPKLYEKLYSMFEPEIFHTKFKARLFYLADIFLSSSHLPENLVAAFVKRLARLSLVAPPQDITTIIYFIGNLILRHPGLKRLICHPSGGQEVPRDPFIMDERDPVESNALESSLWEIASLQQHVIPSIAQAANIIFNPLPKVEWNLGDYLEINENDIFDQEMVKRSKECALSFERPQPVTVKCDKFTDNWKLF